MGKLISSSGIRFQQLVAPRQTKDFLSPVEVLRKNIYSDQARLGLGPRTAGQLDDFSLMMQGLSALARPQIIYQVLAL